MRLPLSSQDSSSPQTNASEKSTARIQQAQQLRAIGTTTVEAIAFWSAVTLPAPILLFLAHGVGNLTDFVIVSGLLGVNLIALYVGHEYSSPETQ